MITIHVPKPGLHWYIHVREMLWGPVSLDGKPINQVLTFQSPFDTFSQGKKFHGENDVSHSKAEGSLTYNPLHRSALPYHEPYFPDAIKLPLSRRDGGGEMVFIRGLAQVSSFNNHDVNVGYRLLASECSPTKLVTYSMGGSVGKEYWVHLGVTRHEHTIGSDAYGGAMLITHEETREWHDVPPGLVPRSALQSLSEMQQLFASAPLRNRVPTTSTVRAALFQFEHTGTFSPGNYMNNILPAEIPQFTFDNSELEHFGNLADRAVSKMNRTSSNLIEFLSELRKPKALIPKLKNLKRLKGYSEEYLRLNYGILPSVSDLQSIFSMFQGKKPYFDKNGFQTYHAGDSQFHILSGGIIEKSRQIKVAVQYENKDLLDILNRIEEIGLLPNASNLWDLVPFSFVLDWFVDVGGFLERADMQARISRLDIPYVTMSDKMSKTISVTPSTTSPISGELSWVSYQRWTTGRCPTPPLLHGKQSTTPERSYWIEAGALIVANKK